MKLRVGGACAPGESVNYKTGVWRTFEPKIDKNKCTKCGICKNYCPDGCITIGEDGCKVNYDYCKGCGVCAHECPVKAIKMEV